MGGRIKARRRISLIRSAACSLYGQYVPNRRELLGDLARELLHRHIIRRSGNVIFSRRGLEGQRLRDLTPRTSSSRGRALRSSICTGCRHACDPHRRREMPKDRRHSGAGLTGPVSLDEGSSSRPRRQTTDARSNACSSAGLGIWVAASSEHRRPSEQRGQNRSDAAPAPPARLWCSIKPASQLIQPATCRSDAYSGGGRGSARGAIWFRKVRR